MLDTLTCMVPNCPVCGDPVHWGFETGTVWVPNKAILIASFQDMLDNGTFYHGCCWHGD